MNIMKINTSVNLSEENLEFARQRAERLERSVSWVINKAVEAMRGIGEHSPEGYTDENG